MPAAYKWQVTQICNAQLLSGSLMTEFSAVIRRAWVMGLAWVQEKPVLAE